MNTSQGALYFGAGIDMNEWRKNITEMRRDILGLNTQTQQETQKMDSAFKNLATGIAGYFSISALQGFTHQLIQVRGEFQKTEIAFGTMLKSKEKAKELMGQMVDLAAKTPFGLQEVSDGAKRLLAFQVPANEVVDTLRRMGDVAAGLGVPMGQLIHVYGQVKAAGKLVTNDLYQFMNAGIPILSELGKVMGKTDAEIKQMVTDGKVGFAEVQQVIQNLTNEGGMFFNLMEAQSGSLSGKVANLGDAWEQMLNKIGQENEGVLYKGIEGLTTLIENYEDVVRILGVLVATYGTYRTALILTAATQKGVATPQIIQGFINLIKLIRGATVAQTALNAASIANPYILLATAIVGLVGAVGYWIHSNKEARNQLNELNQAMEQHIGMAGEEISQLDRLYETATDDKKSRKEREEAIMQLQSQYPSYFGNISQEIIMNGKARDSYLELKDAILESAKAKAAESHLVKLEEKRLKNNIKKEKAINDYTKTYQNDNGRKNPNVGVSDYTKMKREEAIKVVAEVDIDNKELDEEVRVVKKQLDSINKKSNVKKYNTDKAGKTATATPTTGGKKEGKGKKKGTGTKKELAEVYSKDSIKDLEERISLWNNAIERADDQGNVKVRAKDKYGKEYETKEITTLQNAKEKRDALEKLLAEKRKKIDADTFDKELAELERQWKVRYMLAEKYGQEVAKAQFPNLKGNSYLEDITTKFKPLDDKFTSGIKLTDEELDQWQKLKAIIDNLKGEKDPFTNWKDSLDEQLEGVENYAEKIAILQDKMANLTNDQKGQGYEAELRQRLQNEEKAFKQHYQNFLKEHATAEEKRIAIAKKYADLYAKVQTEAERKKVENAEKEENSAFELDLLKDSEDWQLALGNLEFAGQNTIKRLIVHFEEFKQIQKDTLQPNELQELENVIDNLKSRANVNPLKGLIDGIKEYRNARRNLKQAENEYQQSIKDTTKTKEDQQKAYKKLADAEKAEMSKKEKLIDDLNKVQAGFNALTEGVKSLVNAFGGMSDATADAIQDITEIGNAAFDMGKSIASGDVFGAIGNGVKLVGKIAQSLSGDKKKERQIKKWAEAVSELKDKYRELEYQLKKTLGEGIYQENAKMIANLRQQQVYLQKMIDTEKGKKKKDSGKIADWQNQKREIDRQISDIFDDLHTKIAGTDAKTLADQLGDALVDAFNRGESAALTYEKTIDGVMSNAVKSALKQRILEEPMKKLVDDMINKMGFGVKEEDTAVLSEINRKEAEFNALKKHFDSKGNVFTSGVYSKILEKKQAELEQLKRAYEDSRKINLQGSFDGLTPEERAEIKKKGQDAMTRYMDALKQYEDLFGSASGHSESLKGAYKTLTEETGSVLVGQHNAIRINTGEIAKNSGFSLETMRNAVGVLLRIEQNTANLYQMKKDLSELNSKVSNGNGLRASGL